MCSVDILFIRVSREDQRTVPVSPCGVSREPPERCTGCWFTGASWGPPTTAHVPPQQGKDSRKFAPPLPPLVFWPPSPLIRKEPKLSSGSVLGIFFTIQIRVRDGDSQVLRRRNYRIRFGSSSGFHEVPFPASAPTTARTGNSELRFLNWEPDTFGKFIGLVINKDFVYTMLSWQMKINLRDSCVSLWARAGAETSLCLRLQPNVSDPCGSTTLVTWFLYA
jgi:hypothetical protein